MPSPAGSVNGAGHSRTGGAGVSAAPDSRGLRPEPRRIQWKPKLRLLPGPGRKGYRPASFLLWQTNRPGGQIMPASLTWFGHATVRLTLPDDRVIFIDPWLTDNPACPDALKRPDRCDLILLTHGHGDHIGDVGALIDRFDPPIVANYDLCNVLHRVIGKGRYSGMNTGGTQVIDGVCVSLTRAYHSSAVETPEGIIYGGMPNGFVVRVEGLATVYHAGDTDVFSDMKLIAQLFAPKIVILPIGDHFTMGAKGAAMAAELLQPTAIVPVHYKSFPMLAQSPDEFRKVLSSALRNRLFEASVGQPIGWTVTGLG